MDIHEHGFLLLALRFIQNVARNPGLVNNRLSAASYLSQPLASNLAKSLTFPYREFSEYGRGFPDDTP